MLDVRPEHYWLSSFSMFLPASLRLVDDYVCFKRLLKAQCTLFCLIEAAALSALFVFMRRV